MFSVVVPTHNRAHRVSGLLKALAAQTFPTDRFDVIVVDNNSDDSTVEVVAEYADRLRLRCVCEERVGSSVARNRGWRLSQEDYVAFTDDDCEVDSAWLQTAADLVAEKSPSVFGGPYYPIFDRRPPVWYRWSYATSDLGPELRPLREAESLPGSNVFYSRSVLERLGGFNERLGRVGRWRGHGADTELVDRARRLLAAESVYYHPGLIVHHHTGPDRLDLFGHLRKVFAQTGVSYEILSQSGTRALSRKEALRVALSAAWAALRIGLEPLRCAATRDRRRYPAWQNYVWEHTGFYMFQLRMYVEQLRRVRRPVRAILGLAGESPTP